MVMKLVESLDGGDGLHLPERGVVGVPKLCSALKNRKLNQSKLILSLTCVIL